MENLIEPDTSGVDTGEMDMPVYHVRFNYKSGSYHQAWYKKVDIEYNDAGDIVDLNLTAVDVHQNATGDLSFPLSIGVKHLESVWVMKTMSSLELYNMSYKV